MNDQPQHKGGYTAVLKMEHWEEFSRKITLGYYTPDGKWEYKVDQMLRNGYDWNGHFYPGIDETRKKIAAAKAAGQNYFLWGKRQTKVPIASAEKYADKMYAKLLKLAPEYEGVTP